MLYIRLSLTCLGFLLTSSVFAQHQSGDFLLRFGIGAFDWSTITISNKYNLERYPIANAAIDYVIVPQMTVGLAATYTHSQIEFNNFSYTPQNRSTSIKESFNWQRDLLNVGFRCLVYFDYSGQSRLYSGIRVSRQWFAVKHNSAYPDWNGWKRPQESTFQLILLGWEMQLSNRFSSDLQIAVGAPFICSFGLAYRLNKEAGNRAE